MSEDEMEALWHISISASSIVRDRDKQSARIYPPHNRWVGEGEEGEEDRRCAKLGIIRACYKL